MPDDPQQPSQTNTPQADADGRETASAASRAVRGDRTTQLLTIVVAPLVLTVVALVGYIVLTDRAAPAVAPQRTVPLTPPPAAPTSITADATAGQEANSADPVSLDAAIGALSNPATDAATHVIVYTESGFSPELTDATAGDTVIFVNASADAFWPASNIHPTHAILPEFDALGPVAVGQSWQFTFVEAGEWRYHDHLNASHGGLISVGATDATGTAGADGAPRDAEDADAQALDGMNRQYEPLPEADYALHVGIYADDDALGAFIDTYGPGAALLVIQSVDENADACHDRAHDIGRIAYEKLASAAFALSSHECQSGGFHGSIEAWFAERGTANLAEDVRVLCAVAENPFTRHQCLHGVGHGIMAWTNYELHQALDLCAEVPGASVDQGSCYTGVFMENVVGGLTGVMGHFTEYLRDDDPVYPCNAVKPEYQRECYLFQTSHMVAVLDWDFAAVGALCDEAPAASQQTCWGSFGRDASNSVQVDPAGAIALCQHANSSEHLEACLNGAVQNGFWEPRGADRSVSFCQMLADDPSYSAQIVDACYHTIIDRAHDLYATQSERRPFCDALPETRRPTC